MIVTTPKIIKMLDHEAVQIIVESAEEKQLTSEQVIALLQALDDAYPEVFERYLDSVIDTMASEADDDDQKP